MQLNNNCLQGNLSWSIGEINFVLSQFLTSGHSYVHEKHGLQV